MAFHGKEHTPIEVDKLDMKPPARTKDGTKNKRELFGRARVPLLRRSQGGNKVRQPSQRAIRLSSLRRSTGGNTVRQPKSKGNSLESDFQ